MSSRAAVRLEDDKEGAATATADEAEAKVGAADDKRDEDEDDDEDGTEYVDDQEAEGDAR